MKSGVLALIAALLCTGCSDVALHAANGKPRRLSPLSVASPGQSWRNPDGSLGVCVMMNVAGGPWPLGTPEPEGFAIEIASSAIEPEAAIPSAAWKERAIHFEGGARRPGACDFVPKDACLLALELVDRDGQDPRLRVSDLQRVITTLHLRPREPDSGNPLFWPLVPVAYAGDAAMAVTYYSLQAAVLVVISPVIVLGLMTYDPVEGAREAAEYEARIATAKAAREAELARDRRCGAEPEPATVSP